MKKLEAIKDYVQVKFICEGKKVIVDEVDKLFVVFPNGERDFVNFKKIGMSINEPPCHHEWLDAMVEFDYKGLNLKVLLSELIIDYKCEVYIDRWIDNQKVESEFLFENINQIPTVYKKEILFNLLMEDFNKLKESQKYDKK